MQLFEKDKLIYLTGDSTEDIEEFDEKYLLIFWSISCIYIIGGLVDHNRLKNITLNKAKE